MIGIIYTTELHPRWPPLLKIENSLYLMPESA